MKYSPLPAITPRASALLLAAATLLHLLPAQTLVPVNTTYDFFMDTTYSGTAGSIRQQVTSETVWRVADDVTVTVRDNIGGNYNGGIFGDGVVQTIRVEPLGTNGRVQFINNTVEQEGAVFSLGMAGARLFLTNVDFIGNQGTTLGTAGQGGGAIRAASASEITMNNVYFEANRARHGGVIYGSGNIVVNSGTFVGNYAHSWNFASGPGVLMGNVNAGYGGAFNVTHSAMKMMIARKSAFTGNWARRGGGAFNVRSRYSLELWDTVDLSNNVAGYGGAIADSVNAVESTEGVFLKYTGTTGITDYVYSGNIAKGSDMIAAEVTALETSGSIIFTPLAKGGGFYISGTYNEANAKPRLAFEIADNVTVSIGKAGNPSALDSIATIDATGTKSIFQLSGTGKGRLILHADNSYYQGSVNVDTGSLILGNQNALLGGVIKVATGATFGGAGTLTTYKQNGTLFAGRTSLTLDNGASLVIGTDTAADAETLNVVGNIAGGSNIVFNHDLFASGSASKLVAQNISLAGSSTINLGLLSTGTFAIMEWSGTFTIGGASLSPGNLGSLSITVAGVANNPRTDAALSINDKTLVVTSTVFNNLAMHWTGAEGSEWTRRSTGAQLNWLDGGGAGETRFFNADTVIFDGTSDSSNAANRNITVADGGVTVSGMEVGGTARYEFRGNGGIEADADAINDAQFTPTGALKKTGEGELVFANSGTNTFHGGIELAEGALTFNRAAQIHSGTAGILFSDSGTLRAASTVSGTLAETLVVAAAKTGALEIASGGKLIYSGTLSSGGAGSSLRKTGGGVALLTGDNTGNTVAISVEQGALMLADAAVLGGNITVSSGAVLGGAGTAGNGGGVTVASGGIIAAGVDTTQPHTFNVHNLAMTGGAVIRLDLFAEADTGSYRKSDRIFDLGSAAISGTNTIDLTSFASGTFNLGNLTGFASDGIVTISTMKLPAGGRLAAQLSATGGTLELVITSDQSREMRWTGSASGIWNLADTNWTDNGAVNQYSYGDRVLFDNAAGSASRDVFIDAGEVRIADMTVSGDAGHTFTGGGIHASAANVQESGIADASGKLVKTGTGTLTFANGSNTFTGGVELAEGTVAIGNGNHLITSATTGVTFTGDATLLATADLELSDLIRIDAGKIATIDSAGHDMTIGGTLAGPADTTLAKTGEGAMVLAANATGFSGTFAVREGILRAGAADVLTAAANAIIVIDAGATLDLDGHDQTLSNLHGAGTVELGAAKLNMNIGVDGAEFEGGFAGSGTVIKAGTGKWLLSGSSSHAGGIVLQAGEIGVAANAALGDGVFTLGSQSGLLSIDADGLNIANKIAGATGTLTLATNGRMVELSGGITGANLVFDGSGTVALSGSNGYSKLTINTPLAIARRAESASGTVIISDGSTLEFRDVESGLVTATLTGDRVRFNNSTLSLGSASSVRNLEIGAGSHITPNVIGALGGMNANVIVRGALETKLQGTLAGNMVVDGGALLFGSTPYGSGYKISSLALSGTLSFENGGEIRLAGLLPTGIHNAVTAYGGVVGPLTYDANQNGVFMVADIVDGNILRITAYNMAIEPGKDIAAGLDAMRATLSAVHSHLTDELLAPLDDSQSRTYRNALWFRGLGTYAEHESDKNYLGYTDNTFAGVVGYDWHTSAKHILGATFAYANTRLETHNNATTKIKMPIFGLHGAFRLGAYYLAADIARGSGSADTVRHEALGNVVTGGYDMDTYGGGLEIGRVWPILTKSLIRPALGLHYTSVSFKDYAETGAGAVRIDNIRTDLLQAVARVDISTRLTMPWKRPGMVDIGLGLRRNLDTKQTNVQATMIEYPDARLHIRGDKYDDSTVMARLGVRMMLTRSSEFSLAYEYGYVPFGDHRNATRRDTFAATVKQSW